MDLPRIAIATGDPAGIGPEIALKAAMDARVRAVCRPFLVGDAGALKAHAKACDLDVRINSFEKSGDIAWADGAVALLARKQFQPGELKIGELGAAHGRAALDSARTAIEVAMAGDVHAVVSAPQTEKSIAMAGVAFDGYPSFVARCTGVDPNDAFLMICFDQMRIAHVTLHVSTRHAVELVTRERVLATIRAVDSTLRKIGIAKPRLAVSGLNPHASEDGLFGHEEEAIIAPAIAEAKTAGIDASGPFGADTMFGQQGFDAFVVMLHDQGHITAKLLARNRSAGLTIGTPVLFSSVAHGSALDIAGKNKAEPKAVIEAVMRLTGMAQ